MVFISGRFRFSFIDLVGVHDMFTRLQAIQDLVDFECVHNVFTNYNNISKKVFTMCEYSIICVNVYVMERGEKKENKRERREEDERKKRGEGEGEERFLIYTRFYFQLIFCNKNWTSRIRKSSK